MKEFTEENFNSPEIQRLSDFLGWVKKGEPWRIPTERLIRLNGNLKRGKYVNQTINDELQSFGLVCKPAIENADYYGSVVVSDPRDELDGRDVTASLPLSAFKADFGPLIYCGPEMPLAKVKTLMVSRDISQIPVLVSSGKNLAGVVTWRSLAQRDVKVQNPTASDVMERTGHVASSADDFLELVDTIIDQEYVLYRIPDGTIGGIITASDLARAFNATTSIYIKLQELESRIRILLDRSPLPDLENFVAKRRGGEKIFRGASDMTFGEYISALENEKIWNLAKIDFDKDLCLKLLEQVRQIRNHAMHFTSVRDDNTEAEKQDETVSRALRLFRSVNLGY